ncbi:MAG: hypothetical protein ACYSUI_11960 [Planctomycetota bacterium]|jgi:hypothetical protein
MPAAEVIALPDGRVLHKFRAYGNGDMADVTDTIPSIGFGLAEDFSLEFFRAWAWNGTGGAAATQQIEIKQKLPHEPSGLYNRVVRRLRDFRTESNDFHDWRVQADERNHWTWVGGTLLVPEWTNPDALTMLWGLECGLATV